MTSEQKKEHGRGISIKGDVSIYPGGKTERRGRKEELVKGNQKFFQA